MPECLNGHPVPDGKRFCGECGIAVPQHCPNGHPVADGKPFCGQCGAPLSEPDPDHPKPARRSRRRLVLATSGVVAVVAIAVIGVLLIVSDDDKPSETATTSPAPTDTTTASTTIVRTTTTLSATTSTTTAAATEPVSAGGLTEGVPERLPSTYETLGFPLPTPSSVLEIQGQSLVLQFPPATADEYDLEEFMRTVPPQEGWTLDGEDPPPGSTFGPTLYYSDADGNEVVVSWFDFGPGPSGTRIEGMDIRVGV